MQCRFFPGAFVLKWTFYYLKAQIHPERFFIAQYVHYTAYSTEKKKLNKIKKTTSISTLQLPTHHVLDASKSISNPIPYMRLKPVFGGKIKIKNSLLKSKRKVGNEYGGFEAPANTSEARHFPRREVFQDGADEFVSEDSEVSESVRPAIRQPYRLDLQHIYITGLR